jgi:hypothetical protein
VELSYPADGGLQRGLATISRARAWNRSRRNFRLSICALRQTARLSGFSAATGYQALFSTTTVNGVSGNNNTATGVNALFFNTTGSDNTATGSLAQGPPTVKSEMSIHFGVISVEMPEVGCRLATGKAVEFRRLRRQTKAPR